MSEIDPIVAMDEGMALSIYDPFQMLLKSLANSRGGILIFDTYSTNAMRDW